MTPHGRQDEEIASQRRQCAVGTWRPTGHVADMRRRLANMARRSAQRHSRKGKEMPISAICSSQSSTEPQQQSHRREHDSHTTVRPPTNGHESAADGSRITFSATSRSILAVQTDALQLALEHLADGIGGQVLDHTQMLGAFLAGQALLCPKGLHRLQRKTGTGL